MSATVAARVSQERSDEQLASAAGAGDESAFDALVLRYRRPLLCYLRRLGLSEARAEEVLQQSLMRAWVSLRQGVAVVNVRAWLYRIAHNAAIDVRRAAPPPAEPLDDEAAEVVALHADPERVLAVREVLADLAALPELQREALLCTAVEGRSNEQAALALGVSSGAVRGLVYRARATLRAAASAAMPPLVLRWAGAAGRRGSRLVERISEVQAGGAPAGAAAVGLVKAGAAVLAVGVVVQVAAPRQASQTAGPQRSRQAATLVVRGGRGASVSALSGASHPRRTGAGVGSHPRRRTSSGSFAASQTPPPSGSGPPTAQGRELSAPSGDGGSAPAPSATSPSGGENVTPPGRVGGGGHGTQPARTRATTVLPPTKTGGQEPVGSGTPGRVPPVSGGGGGGEAPPGGETSGGDETNESGVLKGPTVPKPPA